MALGREVPPRRAIAVSSAREGEKVWNVASRERLKDTVLDPNLVVDHDSGLKNRCSPSRFREIAIDNLSLPGGSTRYVGVWSKRSSEIRLTDIENKVPGASSHDTRKSVWCRSPHRNPQPRAIIYEGGDRAVARDALTRHYCVQSL